MEHAHLSPWDERLALTEPVENPDAQAGLNEVLHTVFADTTTQLPRLVAQVRTTLGLAPEGMAALADLSRFRYLPLEQDATGPKSALEKYAAILQAWRVRGVSVGIREQLLELLAPDTSIDAFYTRAFVDVGPTTFRKHLSSFWTTLQQRKSAPASVPKPVSQYGELMGHVDALYPHQQADAEAVELRQRREHFAQTAWIADSQQHYDARNLEGVLARMHMFVEQHCWRKFGAGVTTKILREKFALGHHEARQFVNGELISLSSMQKIVTTLGVAAPTDWEPEWQAAVATEEARQTFAKQYAQVFAGTGFSLVDVAAWLDVQPTRGEAGENFRPDQVVRAALQQNINAAGVSPAAMIAVATADAATRSTLLRAYRDERTRHYIRSGSWLRGPGLHARIEREWAGEGTSIARILPMYNKGLRKKVVAKNMQLYEEQRKNHGIDPERLLEVLGDIAQERVEAALERKAAAELALLGEETVRGFVMAAVLRNKGAATVAAAMEDAAGSAAERLTAREILDITEGKLIPSLPVLRSMATALEYDQLPPAVSQEWLSAYPLWLRERKEQPVTHPLARVLATMIARVQAGSVRSFYDDRYLGGAPSQASMHARRFFSGEADMLDAHVVLSTVLAAGYEHESMPYLLAQQLSQNNGNIPAAIKALEALGLEPEQRTPQHLIGLTADECTPPDAETESR